MRTPKGGLVGKGELDVTCDDDVLLTRPESLPDGVENRVSVYLARTTQRSLDAGQNKTLSNETLERLRALGYLR